MGWNTEINTLTNEKNKETKMHRHRQQYVNYQREGGKGVVKENGREMGSNTW